MAKTWNERLANLSAKLDELSKNGAEAYRQLRTEAIQQRISTARGNVAAMRENARLEGFRMQLDKQEWC